MSKRKNCALDTILDRSIVFSFDRTGFARHARRFDPLPQGACLRGREVLVTGANSGIGFSAARALLARGANVHLLCRNPELAQQAAAELESLACEGSVRWHQVDLASRTSVEGFCKAWGSQAVDILIHNAGSMPRHYATTPAGVELTLATNLLGPMLLTRRLLPALEKSTDGRLLWVSSGGMYGVSLSLTELFEPKESYSGVRRYAYAKRAMVSLSELLAQRHPKVFVAAMHPGWVDSRALRSSMPGFAFSLRPILRTPEQGADTLAWLALTARQKLPSGGFWFDRMPQPTHVRKSTNTPSAELERLAKLWDGISSAPLF